MTKFEIVQSIFNIGVLIWLYVHYCMIEMIEKRNIEVLTKVYMKIDDIKRNIEG